MDPQQGFNIHALVKEFLFRIRVVTRFAHSLAPQGRGNICTFLSIFLLNNTVLALVSRQSAQCRDWLGA
jgi:hypothetical protein